MKKKIIAFSLIIAGFSFQACESLVEVEPQTRISAGAALASIDGYQAVLTSAYDRMQDFAYYGRDFALLGDALADNIRSESSQAAGRYISANQNGRGAHYGMWATAYDAINDVNVILATIDGLQVPSTQEPVKARIKAEALALRGLFYFDLARVYGYEPTKVPTSGTGAGFNKSVILRLTPTNTPGEADFKARATNVEVYTQIEKDFKASLALFNDANLKIAPRSRNFMNKAAANALLGKVYLYWEKWAQAEEQFKAALAEPAGAQLSTNIVGAFTGSGINPESLFELTFIAATEMGGVTGVNNSAFSYTQPTGKNAARVSTYGGQLPSSDLIALFEPGDSRLNFFFVSGSSTSGALTYTWANKYNGSQGAYTDNIKIIRYADVMLMLAEAHVKQNENAEAIALLTTLRQARGASVTAITAAPDLMNFIREERRRELFFEGHRFFDLKRWGMAITKAPGITSGIVDYTDYRILAPIPDLQVTLSDNVIVQNPGY